MTTKTFKYSSEFKQYLEGITRKCLELVGHDEYGLNFEYMPEPYCGDDDDVVRPVEVYPNTSYLWAGMKIYPHLMHIWETGSQNHIGELMMHEVCHLLTDPIGNLVIDNARPSDRALFSEIIERQTQRIANAVLKQLPTNWHKLPKKRKSK